MTFEELVREYVKLFILIIETVGQDVGNKIYQNVSNILKEDDSEKAIQSLIDNEVPFFVVVSTLETIVLCKLHNSKDLYENNNILQGLVGDMWERYLKLPSNRFFRKNGLPTINRIDENGIIMLKKL